MYSSAVFVLILALVSRSAVSTPLRPTRSVQSDQSAQIDQTNCTTRARDLLTTLKRALDKSEKMGSSTLFHGFNCTDLGAVMNPNTQTTSVCQPIQDMKCSNQNTSPFSKTECLQNIANDLDYHQSMLTKYIDTLDSKSNVESIMELKSITSAIDDLKEECKLLPRAESSTYSWNPTNSFEDRKDLCKQLKGFQVRTITINRALGYMCAGSA